MKNKFLKLSPGYFALWFILVLVVGSKIFFLRGITNEALVNLGVFGVAMLVISYLGAWAVWTFRQKDQRTGEISYLAIITLFFLVRTILLYREGFAAV